MEKLTNEYVVFAEQVKGLDQVLGEVLKLLKRPNPIMETLEKVIKVYPKCHHCRA